MFEAGFESSRLKQGEQLRLVLFESCFQIRRYSASRRDNQVRRIGAERGAGLAYLVDKFENVVHSLSSSGGEKPPMLEVASGLSSKSAVSRRAVPEHTARCSLSETYACKGFGASVFLAAELLLTGTKTNAFPFFASFQCRPACRSISSRAVWRVIPLLIRNASAFVLDNS